MSDDGVANSIMLVGATEMPNDGSRNWSTKLAAAEVALEGVEVAAREDYMMDGPPIRLQAKICGWGMNLEVSYCYYLQLRNSATKQLTATRRCRVALGRS